MGKIGFFESSDTSVYLNKIENLEAENKALKERDWEECCEEIKHALREENKALEMELELKGDRVTEQAMEISALKEKLADLNLVKFESGDDCYDVPKAAVDNWEAMKEDCAVLIKKFKALRINRDELLDLVKFAKMRAVQNNDIKIDVDDYKQAIQKSEAQEKETG